MNMTTATQDRRVRRQCGERVIPGLAGLCSYPVVCLLIVLGAIAVRLPDLGSRPMHCDEGNQAFRTGMLLETGHYRYDPQEHHGPSLYWITAASLRLRGISRFADTSEFDYRIVPVLFSAGLIVLFFLLEDGLGRGATVTAALLAAISPAMVYYSRYYIQEMLLVFFTIATIVSAWRYVRSHSMWWAIACGACVGLMHATKETWVLAAAAMVVGLVLTLVWSRWRDGCLVDLGSCVTGRSFGLAVAAALSVSALVYSSYGTNWRGTIDSVLAYEVYFHRGSQGGIHSHPWHYYLQLLSANRPARGFFWSEGLIVGLALVGSVRALASSGRPDTERLFARFVAIYTVVLTGIYSAIPYKTPWCLLSFWTGMILLAGVGAAALFRWTPTVPGKGFAISLLVAGAVQLGWQSYQLNYRFPADARNPYVYAHTSPDLLNVAAQWERLSRVSPHGRSMAVHVVTAENYWPLPWYLRGAAPNCVGYWRDWAAWAADAARLDPAEIVITTPDEAAAVVRSLRARYTGPLHYGLRPGVLLCLYVREDLWQISLQAQEQRGAPPGLPLPAKETEGEPR